MQIETKFNIGDWVNIPRENVLITRTRRRDGKEEEVVSKCWALKVQDIITETCMAGTQITYVCRAHVYDRGLINSTNHHAPCGKYREDELEGANVKIVSLIENRDNIKEE